MRRPSKLDLIKQIEAFTTRACEAARVWREADRLEAEARRARNEERAKELWALARAARAEYRKSNS